MPGLGARGNRTTAFAPVGRGVACVVCIAAISLGAAQAPTPGTTPPYPAQPSTPPAAPAAGPAGGAAPRATGGPTFQVAAASATSSTLDLPLPDSGIVPITIIRACGAATSTFTATVTGFQDSSGAPMDAALSAAGTQRPVTALTDVAAPSGVAQLALRITPVPKAGVVTGVLTVTADTTSSWRIVLSRGGKPTATLVTDNPLIVRALTCHWLLGCGVEQGEASVRVWDKTHSWPLENVTVRLEQVTKAGTDFDGLTHLRTAFNGAAKDLWSAPAAADSTRDVPAGGQGLVAFTMRDLRPGEYNATVRLSAANSLADDAQKVTFQVTVKHSIIWALLLLLVGLLISLFGTKWLAAFRKRLEIESTLSQLSASWLRQEPPTSALVWTLANLRLIGEAARKSLLSIPDSVGTRIESVKAVVSVLRSIHDTRALLVAAPIERNMPPFVAARATGALNAVVRRCEPPLDAALVAALGEDLKALQTWFGPGSWEAPYWADLAPALRSLVQDVRPADLAAKPAQEAVEKLLEALAPYVKPDAQRPADAIEVERHYAALKVLWERRSNKEFDELVTAYTTKTLEDVFRIADDRAWDRLQTAVKNGQVAIERLGAHSQALEPFTLAVVPSDPQLAATFLFRHSLQYEWRIERAGPAPGEKPRRFADAFVLTQRTVQPIISQYAPEAMTLKASVTIRRTATNAQPLTLACNEFVVTSSESLGLFSSFSGLDVLSTGVAGVIAAITGLSTFYFASPTFGAPKDYVALALWALAFDQAKNGIVQLSTPGAASAKPPGPP